MKILVGNKGNVDFNAPVPMTKAQQDSFVKFMKSIFHPDIVKIEEPDEFRVDRIGDRLFLREWTRDEIAVLLDVHTNINKACEMLGRTWMSVDIKRGEVIPDLMKWAHSKGYDLIKGDVKKIIEEYLKEKKDLAKEKRAARSAERKKITALIAEHNRNLSLLKTIEFRIKAGIKLPNEDETIRKTKAKLEAIEKELGGKI